jgi:CRP-like cAMP-binding protein
MPTSFVTDALAKRMRKVDGLDDDDIAAIESLPIVIKDVSDHETVIRDGEHPNQCCLVVEGFAVRSKLTSGGRRQILSVHIAGDIPDLQSLHLHVLDHDLITLTPCRLGFIPHAALRALNRERPNIAEALWRDTLIDAALFREWIINVGQRRAPERLAHLLLEIRERLRLVGRAEGDSFMLPMTQEELSDALGLTPVHINRTLKQLRTDELLSFHRNEVKILDNERFEELAQFDRLYLHQHPSA